MNRDIGWFDNPDRSGGYRYFDGQAWAPNVRRLLALPPTRRDWRRLVADLVGVVIMAILIVLLILAFRSARPAIPGATRIEPPTQYPTRVLTAPTTLDLPGRTIPVLAVPPPGPGGAVPEG